MHNSEEHALCYSHTSSYTCVCRGVGGVCLFCTLGASFIKRVFAQILP